MLHPFKKNSITFALTTTTILLLSTQLAFSETPEYQDQSASSGRLISTNTSSSFQESIVKINTTAKNFPTNNDKQEPFQNTSYAFSATMLATLGTLMAGLKTSLRKNI